MDQQPEPEQSAPNAAERSPVESPSKSLEDAALLERAAQVHAVLEAWSLRLVDAVRSGRAATANARMATARTVAELRRLATPSSQRGGSEDLAQLVADYLRQVTNSVSNAAHEIERNHYTLTAMERQLKKLNEIYERIHPQPEAKSSDNEAGSEAASEL
jgi:hypothetical protein